MIVQMRPVADILIHYNSESLVLCGIYIGNLVQRTT